MKKVVVVTFELEDSRRIEDVAKKIKELVGVTNVGYGIIQGAQEIKWPKKREEFWKTKLKEILSELGVSSHLVGYKIIFCAAEYLSSADVENVRIKNIYSYVYDKLKIKYNSVDKNIRYIIENILSHNSYDKISSVLGVYVGNIKLTPSNFFILLKESLFG